jgi:Tfp pilus assembly protein PilV
MGFTLIETLVAVSLLTVAIVAPISLTAQALATAYYARDQVTAFYLAQEGIEIVRSVRDHNVLQNALGTSVNLLDFNGQPLTSLSPFIVDTTKAVSQAITYCGSSDPASCLNYPLRTDGTVYAYSSGMPVSHFTRYVTVCYIQASGQCNSQTSDEIRVAVTVLWNTGSLKRTFTISEDMYRWVNDNAAA